MGMNLENLSEHNRTLYVKTRGGICNRLNKIINGLYYHEKYSFDKLCIVWIHNNHCLASFGQLFARSDFDVLPAGSERAQIAAPFKGCRPTTNGGKLEKKYEHLLMGNKDCHLLEDPFLHPNIPTEKVMELISTKMPRPSPHI